MRRDGEHAARDLETDVAVDPGRYPNRAPTIGRVGYGHDARSDHRSAARRRTAGRVVCVPWISRDVDGGIFGGTADTKFWRCRTTDYIEPSHAHLGREKRIGRRPIAAHQQRTHFLQPALHRRAEILHQERKAGERPVEVYAILSGRTNHVVENLTDSRYRWIHLADTNGGLCAPLPHGPPSQPYP